MRCEEAQTANAAHSAVLNPNIPKPRAPEGRRLEDPCLPQSYAKRNTGNRNPPRPTKFDDPQARLNEQMDPKIQMSEIPEDPGAVFLGACWAWSWVLTSGDSAFFSLGKVFAADFEVSGFRVRI